MKGWQEALRARYHPMIPPETAASLAYRFPNHVAFTPKMFINEKWRSSSYDFALKYPIVYEAVILEVDSNWEGGNSLGTRKLIYLKKINREYK